MMNWDRARYELRILGPGSFLLPPAVAAIYLGFSCFAYNSALDSSHSTSYATFEMGRGLLALLENGLPLLTGLLVAAATNDDAGLELHLSLPTSYRSTILRRAGQVGGYAFAVTLAVCAAVIAAGYWIVPLDQPLGLLVWFTPMVFYFSAGMLLTLLLRSRVASSTVLGMVWIASFLFKNEFLNSSALQRVYPFLTEEIIPSITRANTALWYAIWLENRIILIAIALAMLAAAVFFLGRNELLLGAEK